MAKFRMQHSRQGNTGAASLIRVVGLVLVLFLLLFTGVRWLNSLEPPRSGWVPAIPENRFFLPGSDSSVQIRHTPYYSLGYAPERELPLWAACEWDALMGASALPSLFDSNYFHMDDRLLAQWRELGRRGEEAARRLGRVYLVTGPVSSGRYFCTWLDEGYQAMEGIGFLLADPNAPPVITTVDSIEALTGLDLFAGLWLDSLENAVEKAVHLPHWELEIRFNPYFAPGKNQSLHGNR